MISLLDCYLPVFKQVLRMTGEPETFTDYAECRQGCIGRLEQAIHDTDRLDTCDDEKMAARVAVIAWLDETVLRSTLPWRRRWQSELLQRKYLDLTVAGERFFTLLAQLDPAHKQAREVFLFCLQQGFHGQYSTADSQPALQSVIAEQRSLCLPEAWQTWPNDAELVPDQVVPTGMISQRLRALLTMTASVVSLYAILFFLLYHYVS